MTTIPLQPRILNEPVDYISLLTLTVKDGKQPDFFDANGRVPAGRYLPTFFRSTFTIQQASQDSAVDTFIHMGGWGRGVVFVNGWSIFCRCLFL